MSKRALKHLGLGLLLVAGTTAAHATAVVTDIDGGDGTYSHAQIASGQFSDDISFDTPTAGEEAVNISFFMDRISSLSAFFNGQQISISQQPNTSYYGSLTALVSPGTQHLLVSGVSTGAGSYAGNVTFGAVPEPATWSMMVLGFGVAGFALRRRKDAANAFA